MSSQKIVKSEEQEVLYYNPEKCSGCLLCMVVCSFKHFKVISEDKSNVKVFPNPDKFAYFISAHCAHCEYPTCEASCPANAVIKDEKGIVKINTTQCIGCRSCNFACPISIPHYDPTLKVSYKCDLCEGDPWCVKFCTTGALRYIPRREARKLINP